MAPTNQKAEQAAVAAAQSPGPARPREAAVAVCGLSLRQVDFFFFYKDFVFNLEKRVKLQSWGR